MIRRMKTLEQDMILVDIHTIRENDPIPNGRKVFCEQQTEAEVETNQTAKDQVPVCRIPALGMGLPLPHLTHGTHWLERKAR